MNKREAMDAVKQLTARSLRNLSNRSSQWEALGLPKGMTEHQRKKVEDAMVELADRLAPEGAVIEQEKPDGA